MIDQTWQKRVDAVADTAAAQFADTTHLTDDDAPSGSDVNIHYGDLAAGPDPTADPYANGKIGPPA